MRAQSSRLSKVFLVVSFVFEHPHIQHSKNEVNLEMVEATTIIIVKNTYAEKPKKFNGEDFKRWQMKMMFYLTTLNLAHILRLEKPAVPTTNTSKEQKAALEAWNHSDFLCQNYILNGLDDILYNVYSTFNTQKNFRSLWKISTKSNMRGPKSL